MGISDWIAVGDGGSVAFCAASGELECSHQFMWEGQVVGDGCEIIAANAQVGNAAR